MMCVVCSQQFTYLGTGRPSQVCSVACFRERERRRAQADRDRDPAAARAAGVRQRDRVMGYYQAADLVVCQVCGSSLRMLHRHVRGHGLTLPAYRLRYPGAATTSEGWLVNARARAVDRGWLHWTQERTVSALRAWQRRTGRPPAYQQWQRAARSHPTPRTVEVLFGSWTAGVRAAGLVPRSDHTGWSGWLPITHAQLVDPSAFSDAIYADLTRVA